MNAGVAEVTVDQLVLPVTIVEHLHAPVAAALILRAVHQIFVIPEIVQGRIPYLQQVLGYLIIFLLAILI